MREILFRGKRIDNGEWVEGFLVRDAESWGRSDSHTYIVNHKHPSSCFGSDIYVEVDPATVGQYTGLQDKNGKRIFEGDIVQFERVNAMGWVTIRTGRVLFGFSGIPTFYVLATTGDGWAFYDIEEIEVIGNIHDNPELVDGGADHED